MISRWVPDFMEVSWKEQEERMNCRETQQMIYCYLNNNLNERELQAFLDHVMECPSCYEELEIYYTIHVALDYLEDEEKGTTNPAQRLRKELQDRYRTLRRHRMFRSFQIILVGMAFAALIVTASIQVRMLLNADPGIVSDGPAGEEKEETCGK